MGSISDAVEARIQADLPKSTAISLDGAMLYLNLHFFRYLEGDRHVTGDCFFRQIGPHRYWLPDLFRALLQSNELVLQIDRPVCWDNQSTPIPDEHLRTILSRINDALEKKYRRFKVEFIEAK